MRQSRWYRRLTLVLVDYKASVFLFGQPALRKEALMEVRKQTAIMKDPFSVIALAITEMIIREKGEPK